jgi:hypothetical protein
MVAINPRSPELNPNPDRLWHFRLKRPPSRKSGLGLLDFKTIDLTGSAFYIKPSLLCILTKTLLPDTAPFSLILGTVRGLITSDSRQRISCGSIGPRSHRFEPSLASVVPQSGQRYLDTIEPAVGCSTRQPQQKPSLKTGNGSCDRRIPARKGSPPPHGLNRQFSSRFSMEPCPTQRQHNPQNLTPRSLKSTETRSQGHFRGDPFFCESGPSFTTTALSGIY